MTRNIASIAAVNELMDKYDLHAKKKYGQNFLVSSHVVEKVCGLVNPGDNVMEIGPGLGALSEKLSRKAGQYIAYEIDEDMVRVLNGELPEIDVRNQDFMTAELPEQGKWTVVSNLPYYITADILWKLFCHSERFDKIIVMVQKEVARKYIVSDDRKDYNALAVLQKYYSDVQPVCNVSRNDFIPKPGVDSSVICFTMKQDDQLIRDGRFTALIDAAFLQRRKKLLTNLRSIGVTEETLSKCGLDSAVRAEELSWKDFVRIYEVLYD